MVFAVVFGLSMDYEVFLVSRMHEEWTHTKDAKYAVQHGLAMTGRVVTAAAIIMIAVFGAFAIGNERALAMMGVGFASAIFIDAFIIRLLLLPAVMHLAGPAMWWMPAWLDKRLPHLNIEPPEAADESVRAGRRARARGRAPLSRCASPIIDRRPAARDVRRAGGIRN